MTAAIVEGRTAKRHSAASSGVSRPQDGPAPADATHALQDLLLHRALLSRYEPPPLSARVYVERSPAEIIALFENRTSYQADKLFADYRGKWMAVRGQIWDVRVGEYFVSVPLKADTHSLVMLTFPLSSKDRLTHRQPGEVIEAHGEIEEAGADHLSLTRCELPLLSS